MTDKLHFSLVSPARELFSGEVDHVIAPGTEGEFGVLPNHAPFMTTLKTGRIRIIDGDMARRFFVRGGFADVTSDGLTILAEEAIALEDLDVTEIERQIAEAQQDISVAGENDAMRDLKEGEVARLSALKEALEDA